MPRSQKSDIVELFGHAPDDLSQNARSLWAIRGCPFVNGICTKCNHDKSIVYGTCSVTAPKGKEVLVCPNRFYADNYQSLRMVSERVFGAHIPFLTYSEFVPRRSELGPRVVALGQKSGREVSLGKKLSLDWVLALIDNGTLLDFAGLEVQTIDITGNYRENWEAYKNLPTSRADTIPQSRHQLNWANVHKRLMPQLIRKGSVFAKSKVCTRGLHFVLPDIVYQKFEDVVGQMSEVSSLANDILSVHTFGLGPNVPHGQIRSLRHIRSTSFLLEEFAAGFVAGPNLPNGDKLDEAIRKVLGFLK